MSMIPLLRTAPLMQRTMWCRSRSVHCWSDVWSGRYAEAWHKKNLYTCHGICSFSVILSGLDNGMNLSESNQYSKPMKTSSSNSSTAHRLLTHHPLHFELMHYQDAYIVSGVWWEPILPNQHLHNFSMTSFTSPV